VGDGTDQTSKIEEVKTSLRRRVRYQLALNPGAELPAEQTHTMSMAKRRRTSQVQEVGAQH
jgi:hypothetical protein